MSIWQLFKRWLIRSRQKKKQYFYTLGKPLDIKSTNSAAQEKHDLNNQASDSVAVNPPHDPNNDPLYPIWIMLSPREQEVTALTCLKYTNPQIAAHLGLSIETVRTYLENVLNKLGLQNKADLRVFFAPWDFSAFEKGKPHR
jgi:DNA-binding CsgD family transcriptional regulator